MNVPPKVFVRVWPDGLRAFAQRAFTEVGMAPGDANLLADLLVAADLRGVFSHGTQQMPRYVGDFRLTRLNVHANVRVVSETDTTAIVDGDYGLGYTPAWRAAHLATDKAKVHGVAATVTRNHGHIGAAGHYSRVASAADCIGMCASASRFRLPPDRCVGAAGGGPPLSVTMPAGNEAPLAPDMGLGLYVPPADFAEMFNRVPAAFFKFLGLGAACHVLAGILAGMDDEADGDAARFVSATQGAFVAAIDVSRFMPIDEFKRHMDRYVGDAQRMVPLPGQDRAELPGTPEHRQEQEYAAAGIPIGEAHQASIESVARELRIDPPSWFADPAGAAPPQTQRRRA